MVAYITKERNVVNSSDENDGNFRCKRLNVFVTYTLLLFRAIHGKLTDIHPSPATDSSRIFEASRHIISDQEETDAGRDNTYRRSATFRAAVLE